MGDVTGVGFGALALLGGVLVTVGLLRRSRRLVLLGAALLVALGGAWVFGPMGLWLGALVLCGSWLGRARGSG